MYSAGVSKVTKGTNSEGDKVPVPLSLLLNLSFAGHGERE